MRDDFDYATDTDFTIDILKHLSCHELDVFRGLGATAEDYGGLDKTITKAAKDVFGEDSDFRLREKRVGIETNIRNKLFALCYLRRGTAVGFSEEERSPSLDWEGELKIIKFCLDCLSTSEHYVFDLFDGSHIFCKESSRGNGNLKSMEIIVGLKEADYETILKVSQNDLLGAIVSLGLVKMLIAKRVKIKNIITKGEKDGRYKCSVGEVQGDEESQRA